MDEDQYTSDSGSDTSDSEDDFSLLSDVADDDDSESWVTDGEDEDADAEDEDTEDDSDGEEPFKEPTFAETGAVCLELLIRIYRLIQ